MFLFRLAQYFDFTDEVLTLFTAKKLEKSFCLRKLRPLWDKRDSIIRMFGRSPSPSLIILPKANRISELFVLGIHRALHHLGTLPLRSTIENLGLYLVRGRCEYNRIVRCCICKPPQPLFQEMDQLLIERFPTSTYSHLYIAIDFCSPFTTYEGSQKMLGYDCIRSCYPLH